MASGNPPLSYSRVTHKPASPTPEYYYAEGGADASPSPYPFRYSREEILAVWDEDKVRERPIELLQLADSGAVIVSQSVVKPVGLRDLSELEKKVSKKNIQQ
jgi:PERQ amino acid-rich with GYF domain-containing protein